MRIAYISYPAFADCDYPLVRALREAGHQVNYFLLVSPFHCHSTLVDIQQLRPEYDIINGSCYQELQLFDNYLDSKSIQVVNFGGNAKKNVFSLWMKFHRELKCFRPDIVQLTHFFPPYSWYFYWSFRNRISMTVHDPIPHSGEVSARIEQQRKVWSKSIKAFILLSKNEPLVQEFQKRYSIPRERIHFAALAPYDCLQVVPQKHGQFPSDFLFVGRISPYKGLDILLQAHDSLSRKGLHTRLIIAGAGSFWFDPAPFEQKNDVTIINRFISTQELVSMIADTKYVVCPYTDGTQSGVIMSALALGKPVIATDVGNFATHIHNGENGFLVEPNDISGLAKIMESAIQPSTLKSLDDSVLSFDIRQAWRQIALHYIEAYRNVFPVNLSA